jgi:cytochrome c peroxidase
VGARRLCLDPPDSRLAALAAGPETWGQFKTPTLRNVARTAPYMHQGQLQTLAQVVEYYSTLRGATFSPHHRESILEPRHFTADEAAALVAFLESLTDEEIDPALKAPPADLNVAASPRRESPAGRGARPGPSAAPHAPSPR